MARAGKILMTLWEVPVNETAELMKDFYSSWLNGATLEEGLIIAQKKMSKKYPPYYSAGFVLIK